MIPKEINKSQANPANAGMPVNAAMKWGVGRSKYPDGCGDLSGRLSYE
jgi:hypothetical protein